MGIPPCGKHLIVDPPAFLKRVIEDAPLAVREIDSVLERFSHGSIILDFIIEHKCYNLKRLKRVKSLYPTAEAGGVYGLFF